MKFIKSKKALIIVIAVAAALLIAIGVFFFLKMRTPWVANIDGSKITVAQFNKFYYAHNKSIYNVNTDAEVDKLAANPMEKQKNPLLDKEFFLDEVIKQRLVYTKAEKEGLTDQDEFKAILEIQQDSLIAAYYAKIKFQDKITVSDQEIAEAFEKEPNKPKGVTLNQASDYIKQQLTQQKLYQESNNLITELKDKAKIEKNDNVLKALADADTKKRPTSGWVAKVDGEEISVKDFNNLYYAQHMNSYNTDKREDIDTFALDPAQNSKNTLLNRDTFLDELIKQKLVYKKAKEEKVLDNSDLQASLQLQKESISIWYYVKAKFSKDVEISDAEIAAAYQNYKDKFKGVPIAQAEQYIRQGLKSEKLRMKTQKLITDLKDEAVIEKNLDLLSSK